MPKKPAKAAPPRVIITPKTQVSTREEGLALITPLRAQIVGIGPITDEDDYAQADALYGRVKTAIKTWEARMEKIIRPIRTGLDELYALKREVAVPLKELETRIEQPMKAFKLAEHHRLLAAEQEKRDIEAEAIEELNRLNEKLEAAKTQPAKAKILQAIVTTELELEDSMVQESAAPVMGEHSGSRFAKRPQVDDLIAFCAGIGKGDIPVDCIELKQGRLNTYYREDPDTVATFAGVSIHDDVNIVGKG